MEIEERAQLLGKLEELHSQINVLTFQIAEELSAIQRVRELHKPFTYEWDGFKRVSGICMECEQDCPCDTIKALDGEQ